MILLLGFTEDKQQPCDSYNNSSNNEKRKQMSQINSHFTEMRQCNSLTGNYISIKTKTVL